VILGLAAFWYSLRLTDRQKDRQTEGHTTTAYTALAERRAVKPNLCVCVCVCVCMSVHARCNVGMALDWTTKKAISGEAQRGTASWTTALGLVTCKCTCIYNRQTDIPILYIFVYTLQTLSLTGTLVFRLSLHEITFFQLFPERIQVFAGFYWLSRYFQQTKCSVILYNNKDILCS